jgi:hypothetical protein
MNHWVWQAEQGDVDERGLLAPCQWPVDETISLLSHQIPTPTENWSLWASHRDELGAYYIEAGHEAIAPLQRAQIWQQLQPSPV